MTLRDFEKISLPLLLSLLFHGFMVLFMTYWVANHQVSIDMANFAQKAEPIKLREIKMENPMENMRTVGVKNGQKNFNIPGVPTAKNKSNNKVPSATTVTPVPAPAMPKSAPAPAPTPQPHEMSLADLRTPKSKIQAPKNKSEQGKLKASENTGSKPAQKQWQVTPTEQSQLKAKVLESIQTGAEQRQMLDDVGFGFEFEPPEGVSEDELNTLEKIYYSYFRRVYETYVRSFLTTYNRLSMSRPGVKRALQQEVHVLRGRVIFDTYGNIVTISILKSSDNDDVHVLFEETLKSMRAVPNPPNDLTKNKEEFNVYYQLNINTR